MTWEHVTVEKRGRVAVVRFQRGDGRNAMSPALIGELTEAARSFDSDFETSAIVLTADGPNFCYGYDLKDDAGNSEPTLAERRVNQSLGPRLCAAWAALEPVTIVAIEGWCIGGGVALVAGLDLRVASETARLYIPEVERGMNMGWQSIPRLVSLIGAPRTRRMTLLAERIDAQRALAWEMVDEVVPQGQAIDAALVMAERIASLPPVQIRMCKEGINVASGALHQALSVMDRDQHLLAQSSADFQEGVNSFLEKRPAEFSGR